MNWFAENLLAWFSLHGRKDLPWQIDKNPYRVWVSEIMLQQTQVATVIDYYLRFMDRFPTVTTLAAANIDEVLHLWTGLGYYARGRNLHRAAQLIVRDHNGHLPQEQQELESLPGIGPSTAGAIRAIAMGQRGIILDGNVKRVLARFHAVEGHYSNTKISKLLWRHATHHTPVERVADYTQAIMDLGATLCVRSKPKCDICPINSNCKALADNRVGELPTKKTAAPKPIRRAKFFVLRLPDGRVLLEKRPQSGIWGGLWNPPERSCETSFETFLDSQGIHSDDIFGTHDGDIFRHTFSHFHLDIEPMYAALKRQPAVLNEGNQRWVNIADMADAEDAVGLSAAALRMLSA